MLEAAGAALKLIILAVVMRLPLGFDKFATLEDAAGKGVAAAVEMVTRTSLVVIFIIITRELIIWLLYSFSEKYVR